MIGNRALRRSLTDFKRHPWLHFVSIATMTLALLIVGGFFLCYRNFEQLADKTNPRVTGTLYLKDGVTETEVKALKEKCLSQENVRRVEYKPRTVVVEELQAFLGGAGMGTIPGSELFPDVMEIELNAESGAKAILGLKKALANFPEIAEVDFSEDWLVQYKKVRRLLAGFGLALMIAVLVGCSFIIANFMGMRHQSRREEIDIVRLIGGHRNFILTPFLWEGIIEGILGSAIALTLLYFVKTILSTATSVHWATLLGIKGWLYLSTEQVFMVIGVGIAMAIFGSFAVFLRFQENSPR